MLFHKNFNDSTFSDFLILEAPLRSFLIVFNTFKKNNYFSFAAALAASTRLPRAFTDKIHNTQIRMKRANK